MSEKIQSEKIRGEMHLVDFLTHLLARVVLKNADNVKNVVLVKHHFEQGLFLQQEQQFKDLEQCVKSICVLQILADVEQFCEFRDICVRLQGHREFLATLRRRKHAVEELRYLIQLREFTCREFDCNGEERNFLKSFLDIFECGIFNFLSRTLEVVALLDLRC